MAKIPLRAYVKEIENLIDRGEIEQAVAHAKNILKSYPKHINTYRLLGKAFLESQRYTEAADILQRVLSVIPDDFVSQIGMSIIREDEGNLDAAIWHMERAYEVQPFNPAVQDELRRLYGRRDGVEPPKIRLTRSALVRMYARGELYPQAIAETRAALAEDPQRLDLSVLLARLYYLSGHKNDAAEVCSELINKLPYCYEANRLLAEILPSVNREEEAKKFQQRIYALDPYEAFVSPNAPTADQVPDQAVTVEQFSWEASMEDAQVPEWTRTVGVEWQETEEEALPDWLNTLKPEGNKSGQGTAAQTEVQPTNETETGPIAAGTAEGEPAAADDLIPDWMKDKGWTTSNRSADEIAAEQAQEDAKRPEEMPAEEISPAEIPDWLQSIAPPEAASSGEDEDRTDWLETLLVQPGGSNGKETTETEQPTVTNESESTVAEEATDLPDWLSSLEPGAGGSINAGEGMQSAAESEAAQELPDWFNQTQGEVESSPASEDLEGLSDWSKVGASSPDSEKSFENETPDWLKSLGSDLPEQAVHEGDQPDWLQELKPRTSGLNPEVPSNPVEQPTEQLAEEESPDWLKELGVLDVAQPESPASYEEAGGIEEGAVRTKASGIEPEAENKAPLASDQVTTHEAGMPDLSDTDSAMAWLESLAAKQGADEATLITPADQRTETPPSWVIEQTTMGDQQPAEDQIRPETPTESDLAAPFAETPTAAGEIPGEVPTVQELTEVGITDWHLETANEQPDQKAGEDVLAAPSQSATMNLSDEDAAMAWLESLAAKQGADEATLVTKPEDRLETPPEWVKNEIEAAAPDEIEQPLHAEAKEVEPPYWPQSIKTPDEEMVEQPAANESLVTEDFVKAETLPEEAPIGESSEPGGEQNDESSVEPTQPVKVSAKPPEGSMPDMSDMDATMAWLESLAAKQGADEATLITSPDQRTEQVPEWITKEMESQEDPTHKVQVLEPGSVETGGEESQVQEPEATAAQEFEAPAVELAQPDRLHEIVQAKEDVNLLPASETEASPTDEMDLDSAFAWLESLAAKQGADEATLINAPEDREETAPDWVKHEQEQAVEEESLLSQSQAQEKSLQAEESVPTAQAFQPEEILSEQQVEEAPDWLKDLGQDEERISTQPEDFESKSQFAPGKFEPWNAELKSEDEAAATSQVTPSPEPVQANTEEVPDWLKQMETEDQSIAAPISEELMPDWLRGIEEENETKNAESDTATSSDDFRSAWTPEIDINQATAEIQPLNESSEPAAGLSELQEFLRRGDLDAALGGYSQFINDGQHLDETIHDLRDALYRYPVDISLWQTLGDAYARNNQLQEALDAYTKAEELLR